MPTSRRHGDLSIRIINNKLWLILIILVSCFISGISSPASAGEDIPDTWLYLRGGEPVAADEDVVEIIAVGDIMLGRSIRPGAQTLAKVAPLLQSADLAFGNFEGVIAPPGGDAAALSTTLPGQPYKLVMPPQVGKLLHKAGFDLVGLANNHALDLESQGLKRTVENLQAAGLDVFGVAPGTGEPAEPTFTDVDGLRLAFLGFTMIPPPSQALSGPAPARYDSIRSPAAIQVAREQSDFVIVMLHWGIEYQTFADPSQQRVTQALIDAGADLVLGAHPHVVQGTQLMPCHCEASIAEAISHPSLEEGLLADKPRLSLARNDAFVCEASCQLTLQKRDAFVAYSLGNFVFDQYQGETANGLALRILLDRDGLRAVQALPLRAGSRPAWLEAAKAQPQLARLQPPERVVGFTCTSAGCQPTANVPVAAATPFVSGTIDLTGDGQTETILLSGGRVEIWQSGKLAWSSPPEWQVLDLDLGDPNDDGRYELLLSLRKPDHAGVSRSHPFIVGYRRGMFKLLWGGSALSTPIGEVALGDVDGDGAQELVALEEQPGEKRTISVWRWHGWGFTLAWRSQPGQFVDLALVQDPTGDVIITVDVKN